MGLAEWERSSQVSRDEESQANSFLLFLLLFCPRKKQESKTRRLFQKDVEPPRV